MATTKESKSTDRGGAQGKELSDLGVPRPSQYVETIASRASRARRRG